MPPIERPKTKPTFKNTLALLLAAFNLATAEPVNASPELIKLPQGVEFSNQELTDAISSEKGITKTIKVTEENLSQMQNFMDRYVNNISDPKEDEESGDLIDANTLRTGQQIEITLEYEKKINKHGEEVKYPKLIVKIKN